MAMKWEMSVFKVMILFLSCSLSIDKVMMCTMRVFFFLKQCTMRVIYYVGCDWTVYNVKEI